MLCDCGGASAFGHAAAEVDGLGLAKMKMLQKMRLLEERGQSFAITAIKDLKVFGEQAQQAHSAQLHWPLSSHVAEPCSWLLNLVLCMKARKGA